LTGPGQPGGTRPHPAHDSPATPRQAAQRADTATRPGQRGCDLPQLARPTPATQLAPTRMRGALCPERRSHRPEMGVLHHLLIANPSSSDDAESAFGVPASAERPRPRSHSVADRPALGWL
jgi:hypothetical protein